MPSEVFQLTTLTRVLAENVELSEPLAFAEISALDDSARKWRSCLQTKAKGLLEDENLAPAISLHRRRVVAQVELDSIEITFEPPKRSPDWQEPVKIPIHFARWVEGEGAGELHQAFVPGLNVHVFATRASLIRERVEAHVRLVLASRRKQISLLQLGELSRVQALNLDRLEVTANRKTPKQIAVAEDAPPETKSILEKLAEQLPPLLTNPNANTSALGGAKDSDSAPKLDSSPVPQAAFEMEPELSQLADALSGPHRRSILLVGPPGSGKTALVRELARRRKDFAFGQTPFWTTSAARLMTGPMGYGMWQERCQQLCREASKTNSILHLGNLSELLEVGKTSRGEQSVGGFLRPWIARGEVLAIAECAPEQLAPLERDEPHLLAAFQQMNLPERSPEQTRVILGRALDAAPGKAPTHLAPVQAALDRLHQLHQRYATYSARPGRPLRFLKNLLADRFPEKVLAEAGVISAFSRETGLPLMLLDDRILFDLESTRTWFSQRVIGQAEAVNRVLDLLAIIKARLARPRKPLASFLFIGPTGTGKTEMAKTIAEFLFSDASRMARFDLNEFSDPASVQRLIGSPAAGAAEGLLTARVREQPFSVLLLDEFEKADPSFFDLLLQILGDGRLTDASGRVADFCNSVIVMTSNLGSQDFQRGPAGFRLDSGSAPAASEHFSDAVRKFLRPEIFNRLDSVVPFAPLSREIVLAIARRHLHLIQQRDGVRLRQVEIELRPELADHLAARAYDARYGARPLKRAIERELLVPLSEALNQYQRDTPLSAEIGLRENRIHIHVRARGDSPEAKFQQAGSHRTEEIAERIMAQRRKVAAFLRCSATSRIEDEVTILESLERRLAKLPWKNPAMQARLARLPKLRNCLAAVTALSERARNLETEALGTLYVRQPLDHSLFEAEIEGIEKDRRLLTREVFRFQQENPDDVVLAFYSEDRQMLLEFAAAYWNLAQTAGQAEALDFFTPPPGGRSSLKRLVRETPKKLDQFFVTPPEALIGIVMHLRGEFFFPRFLGEAGTHTLRQKKKERVCLIETAGLPFAGYEPPQGIERPGAIKDKGAPQCRVFDREENVVIDALLGHRPFSDANVLRCITALTEERLSRMIEGIVR